MLARNSSAHLSRETPLEIIARYSLQSLVTNLPLQVNSNPTSWFGGKDKGSSDELAYLRQQLTLKEHELAAKNKDLAAKMAELATISKTLSVKEVELLSKDQVLTTKTEELSVTSTQLTTTEGELAAQKEETAAKAREVDTKEQELIALWKELASKDDTIRMLETTITTLRSQTTVVSDCILFCCITWKDSVNKEIPIALIKRVPRVESLLSPKTT